MKVNKEMINCDNTQVLTAIENVRLVISVEGGANLLCAGANAYITSCRVQDGEVRAEGVLSGSVTFENEDFDCASERQEFSAAVNAQGEVTANAVASVTNCRLSREGASAILDVEITVSFICVSDATVSVITSVEEGAQIQTKEMEYSSLVGMYNSKHTVHESIELNVRMPMVKQCLQASPSAVVDRVLIKDNSVMITGDIVLGVLYSCGDEYEPVTQVADRLPFSAVIDAPGADDNDTAMVIVAIAEGSVRAQENQQGEMRIITCDLDINCIACVLRNKKAEVITDAYDTEYMLECTEEHIALDSVTECRKQQSVRVTVEKPEAMPPIARVCSVNAFPTVIESATYNGGATLRCRACFHVVYIVSGSGEIAGFDTVSDFELNIDCPCRESTVAQAFLSTELLQAALLSGSKCEVRMVLNANMLLIDKNETTVLQEICKGEERPQSSGICIYIAQAGDTLFTIGQQLGVAMEDLLELNPELEGAAVERGTRITVFRKINGA